MAKLLQPLLRPSIRPAVFPATHAAALLESSGGESVPPYEFVNAAAEDFVARMDPEPSDVWKAAFDELYQSSSGAATWETFLARFDGVYMRGGPHEQAALLNMAAANAATKSGTLQHTAREGFCSNGNNNYLDTGLTHSSLTKLLQDSASLIAYVRYQRGTTSTVQVGLSGNGGRFQFTLVSSGSTSARVNRNAAHLTANNADLLGLFIAERTAADAAELLIDGVSLDTDVGVSVARSAQTITEYRNNTSYTEFGTVVLGFTAYGPALTTDEKAMLAAALPAFFEAVAAEAGDPGVTTATAATDHALPDGQASTAGKGFTCTGLSRDADDTWWMGNYGRASDQDPATNVPAIVHLSADFSTVIDEFDLSAVTTTDGPQAVVYDPDLDTIWWTRQSSPVIRQINKATGVEISNITMSSNVNAMTYDTLLDCLIVCGTDGSSNQFTVFWIDKATGGRLRWLMIDEVPDQFWFDPSTGENGQLWMSYGGNGSTGQIDIWDIAARAKVDTIALDGALAIEGIYKEGNSLYAANDLFYHAEGLANVVKEYTLS